jgi:CheY-like chemotaxis protein
LNDRILIIDDDPDILATGRFVLENAGYQVSTASNGSEALDRLRGEAEPSLILLDLMMPGMNGWEFRAEQRRDPKLSAIPVVIMTGAGKAASMTAFAGVAGLLEKPVSLRTLLSTVQLYCKAHAPEPS